MTDKSIKTGLFVSSAVVFFGGLRILSTGNPIGLLLVIASVFGFLTATLGIDKLPK